MPNEFTHKTNYHAVTGIAQEDVNTLMDKDRSYGSSWKKRGGVGAFMMLARKWDRIENQVGRDYDIFKAATKEGLYDDIRDLRAYLLLVEEYCLAYEAFHHGNSVHAERAKLGEEFNRGRNSTTHLSNPMYESPQDDSEATREYVRQEGKGVPARWPGDVYHPTSAQPKPR